MAVPKPEGESFNRLLVSVGAGALGLGISVPWLILREDSSLMVTEDNLGQLSDRAQSVVRDRQDWMSSLQSWAPLFTAVICVIGIGLLIWGAVRLFKQQGVVDKMADAQLRLALQQLHVERQSPEEVAARRQEEATEELGDVDLVLSALPESSGLEADVRTAIAKQSSVSRTEFVATAVRAEYEVMQAVARVTDPDVKVTLQPEISGSRGGPLLRADALLTHTSCDGLRRDLFVEVKLLRPVAARKNLTNRVREFAGTMYLALDILGDQARGLLVLVLDDSEDQVEPNFRSALAIRAKEAAPTNLQVEVVALSELDTWSPGISFPPDAD